MSAKILVTGATGNFGKTTIDFLLEKGIAATNISALVRDEAKAEDLKGRTERAVEGAKKGFNSKK